MSGPTPVRAPEDAVAAERRAREAAERHADRMRRLAEVATALSSALTARDVARVVVDQTSAEIEADTGGVWLLDNGHARLELVAERGMPPSMRARGVIVFIVGRQPAVRGGADGGAGVAGELGGLRPPLSAVRTARPGHPGAPAPRVLLPAAADRRAAAGWAVVLFHAAAPVRRTTTGRSSACWRTTAPRGWSAPGCTSGRWRRCGCATTSCRWPATSCARRWAPCCCRCRC